MILPFQKIYFTQLSVFSDKFLFSYVRIIFSDMDCTLNSQCSDFNAYCDQQGGTQKCRCPSNQKFDGSTGKCTAGNDISKNHRQLYENVSLEHVRTAYADASTQSKQVISWPLTASFE